MASRQSAKNMKQQYTLQFVTTGTDQASADIAKLEQKTVDLTKASDLLNLDYAETEQALKAVRAAINQLNNVDQKTIENQMDLRALYNNQLVLIDRRRQLQRAASNDALDQIEAERQAEEERARAQREQAGLYGDVESRTRAITGAIGFVGGEGGQQFEQIANVGAEILASVEAVSLLQQELPALAASLTASAGSASAAALSIGAIAAALGGFLIVAKVFQDQVNKSKDATEQLINVNERYASLIATGTTKEIQDAITANEERNRALELERERLQAFVDAVDDVDGVTGAVLDLNKSLGLNFGGYKDVQNELKDVNQEIANNADLNNQLEDALANGIVAANDARVAEEELAAAREEAFNKQQAILLQWVSSEADRLARIREAQDAGSMSIDQYLDKMDQLNEQQQQTQDQIDLLNALYEQGLISQEAWYDQLAILNEELWAGQDVINAYRENFGLFGKLIDQAAQDILQSPVIGALKEGVQGAMDFGKEAVMESRNIFNSLFEDWNEFLIDWQRAEQDFQIARERDLQQHYDKLAQIDAKFTEAVQKLNEERADYEREFRQESAKELRDYLKEERRAAADHRERMLQIRDRMNASIMEASAKLDAFAIWQAKQRAEEESRQEKRNFDQDKRRRREDFMDRQRERMLERRERMREFQQKMQDLINAHQRERAEQIKQFNQQQAIEVANYNLRMARLQEDFVRQQQLTAQAYESKYGIELWWWDQLNLLADQSMASFVQTVSASLSTLSAAGAGGTTTPVGVGVLPAFARGGRFSGLGVVGENGAELVRTLSPVRVTPTGRAPANVRMGGVTNNFNNTGNFSHRYLEMVAIKAAQTVVKQMVK